MDTENEINVLKEYCNSIGIKVSKSTHWSDGGEGAKDLAKNVVEICDKSDQNNRSPRLNVITVAPEKIIPKNWFIGMKCVKILNNIVGKRLYGKR